TDFSPRPAGLVGGRAAWCPPPRHQPKAHSHVHAPEPHGSERDGGNVGAVPAGRRRDVWADHHAGQRAAGQPRPVALITPWPFPGLGRRGGAGGHAGPAVGGQHGVHGRAAPREHAGHAGHGIELTGHRRAQRPRGDRRVPDGPRVQLHGLHGRGEHVEQRCLHDRLLCSG
uniref:Uncharacterized protein n=1 Tax=Triticum urartu TaxID=4572 RepID=A0A8R7V7R0_TRIUA